MYIATQGTNAISLKYSCLRALLAEGLLLGSKQSIFWNTRHIHKKLYCLLVNCHAIDMTPIEYHKTKMITFNVEYINRYTKSPRHKQEDCR